MNKKVNASVINQITGIASLTKNIKEAEEIKKEKTLIFSYHLDEDTMNFIQDFIHYKRFENGKFEYNLSSMIKEGVSLLKERYPNIPNRPENVKIPTIRGRKKRVNEDDEIKYATSFNISESDREFIYNFIYDKLKKGEDYIKEDFMNDLITEIKRKYKMK